MWKKPHPHFTLIKRDPGTAKIYTNIQINQRKNIQIVLISNKSISYIDLKINQNEIPYYRNNNNHYSSSPQGQGRGRRTGGGKGKGIEREKKVNKDIKERRKEGKERKYVKKGQLVSAKMRLKFQQSKSLDGRRGFDGNSKEREINDSNR